MKWGQAAVDLANADQRPMPCAFQEAKYVKE